MTDKNATATDENFIWHEMLMDLYVDVRKLTGEDYHMSGDSMLRQLIESIVEQVTAIQTLAEGNDDERRRCMERIIANREAHREDRRGRAGIGLCG